MTEPSIRGGENTTFTLNIDDRIYRCPVSDAALYMLCRDQDSSMDQLDAYLLLKGKIQATVERLLETDSAAIPDVLEPPDLLR